MGRRFFGRSLGIDLGTANTLVYSPDKGIVLREPSVVAVRDGNRRQEVLAVGEEAKCMIGRTPGNIVAVRPLKEGVIASFAETEMMLKYFIKKAIKSSGRFGLSPKVVICVPCGITEVERRAVEEAAKSAGARDAIMMEEPMAAAIGAGLPVQEPTGSMVVDIGGGTSEVAVIALGGVVVSESLRVGGNNMDDAIIQYIKREYNMVIGERTAEEIKISIGTAVDNGKTRPIKVRGRDLVSGLPNAVEITSEQIAHALKEPVHSIVSSVRQTLEATPPELAADIIEHGIVLTGGGAQLKQLDKVLAQSTGMEVHVAPEPLDCVVVGAGLALQSLPEISARQGQGLPS